VIPDRTESFFLLILISSSRNNRRTNSFVSTLSSATGFYHGTTEVAGSVPSLQPITGSSIKLEGLLSAKFSLAVFKLGRFVRNSLSHSGTYSMSFEVNRTVMFGIELERRLGGSSSSRLDCCRPDSKGATRLDLQVAMWVSLLLC